MSMNESFILVKELGFYRQNLTRGIFLPGAVPDLMDTNSYSRSPFWRVSDSLHPVPSVPRSVPTLESTLDRVRTRSSTPPTPPTRGLVFQCEVSHRKNSILPTWKHRLLSVPDTRDHLPTVSDSRAWAGMTRLRTSSPYPHSTTVGYEDRRPVTQIFELLHLHSSRSDREVHWWSHSHVPECNNSSNNLVQTGLRRRNV